MAGVGLAPRAQIHRRVQRPVHAIQDTPMQQAARRCALQSTTVFTTTAGVGPTRRARTLGLVSRIVTASQISFRRLASKTTACFLAATIRAQRKTEGADRTQCARPRGLGPTTARVTMDTTHRRDQGRIAYSAS